MSLSGLAGWYQAGHPLNDVVAGPVVKSLYDLSGNSRLFEQANGTRRPVDTTDVDGRPVAQFDGTDDALQVNSPPDLSAGLTVFCAYRVRSHTNGQGLIGAGAAGDGQGRDVWFEFASAFTADQTQLRSKAAQVDPIDKQLLEPTGDKALAIFAIDLAAAEYRTFLTSTTDTSTSVAFGTPDIIALGSRVFNQFISTPHGAIDVYECGFYDRVLSSAELDLLEIYLKSRNGIGWSPGYLLADLTSWHDDWSDFTLTGALVDQWDDRSGSSRHYTATTTARPTKTTQNGLTVVRFDGSANAMTMGGTLAAISPGTHLVVYRLQDRADNAGIWTPAPAAGVDHLNHAIFQLQSAAADQQQVFGRSTETGADQLVMEQPDSDGLVRAALFTFDGAGAAELYGPDGAPLDSDAYAGSIATPVVMTIGARFNSGTFGFAEVDLYGIVSVDRVVTSAERADLLDWAAREFTAV